MIVLDIEQAVQLARDAGLPVDDQVRRIEEAMNIVGLQIAQRYRVSLKSATVQSPAFAGAAICFAAMEKNQECPPELQELDPDGELGEVETNDDEP